MCTITLDSNIVLICCIDRYIFIQLDGIGCDQQQGQTRIELDCIT